MTGKRLVKMNHLERTQMPWKKSSRSSGTGQCVEVAFAPDAVAIRDSKDPHGHMLAFIPEEWTAFIHDVRNGRFDLPG